MASRHVDGVLIVGGGYAGVHTARSVRRAGGRATIVDPTGRHDFVTRLAAVAGGASPESDASAPLSDFATEVIEGTVTAIRDGEIDLADHSTLTADAVVVTIGSVPVKPPIDGLEHAHPLRTASDALSLRAMISATDDVVIVGGGATGVQLAGAISATRPDVTVTLVDGSERLLAALGESTGQGAERILRDRGVEFRLGEEVDRIEPDAVHIGDDRIVGLPIWAAGFDPRGSEFDLPTDDTGSVCVDETLLIEGYERTFAAGDIARHPDDDGGVRPMSAQIAVQAGDAAGENAQRLVDGRALKRAELEHRGWVLDLRGHRGLAELGPLTLTGPVADLVPPFLHWAIDMKHLIETEGLAGFADRPGA